MRSLLKMNEALTEYISKRTPRIQESLGKATKGMTDQQQQDFLAAMQFGDTEFQSEIAPYMPEGSTIDPSKAALVPLPLDMREKGQSLKTKGISRRGTDRLMPLEVEGKIIGQIPGNAVSALGAINANPQVYAHEYRHQEDSDAFYETNNRLLDVFASRTKTDFKRAVASLADAALYEAGKKAVASGDEEKSQSYKTTENAYYSANSKDPSIKELDSALNDLLTNDPYISNQLQKVNNLIALGNIEAPAVGPQYKRFLSSKKERKQEKERKQKIKDEGYEGAGFLPMDFKEGGRSKLI